jgi:DNA-binding response OmpR family regulator
MKGNLKKLLVVEDNKETQLLIKVSLRNDFDVKIAASADNAFSLLLDNHFDLVLLDVNLNGHGDGKSILKNIREEMKNNDLRVLVTTAYDLSDDDKKYFDENANGFIQKPFDKKILLSSINHLLNKN